MNILLIIAFLIVVLLISLSSMSQSYASAKQAQAAIEASRAAQIASAGNLVIIVLVVVAVVIVVALLAWVYLRTTARPKRCWVTGADSDWVYLPNQHQTNAMLPALVTMLMYQLMKNQQEQHQHEVEQFWMMHEPANELPIFSDSTGDL